MDDFEQAKMNSFLYSNRLIILVVAALIIGYYFKKDVKKMAITILVVCVLLYFLIEWVSSRQASDLLKVKSQYRQHLTDSTNGDGLINNAMDGNADILQPPKRVYFPGSVYPGKVNNNLSEQDQEVQQYVMQSTNAQNIDNPLVMSGTLQGNVEAYRSATIPQQPVPAERAFRSADVQRATFNLY